MSATLADSFLDGLAHLICTDDVSRRGLPASTFDGFEPLVDMQSELLVLTGSTLADQPVWPVDVCVGFPTGAESGWHEGAWQFVRYRTLDPKEWRGKLRRVFPRMLDVSVATTSPDGRRQSLRQPFAIAGDKLLLVPMTGTVGGSWAGAPNCTETDAGLLDAVRHLGGFALRRRYYWSVLLGEGSGPRARFLTDAIGLRAAFRLRDIEPGMTRRAALSHWVRAHWRQRRQASADDHAWVRRHVRGRREFDWNGFYCQIEPSQEDMELLQAEAAS